MLFSFCLQGIWEIIPSGRGEDSVISFMEFCPNTKNKFWTPANELNSQYRALISASNVKSARHTVRSPENACELNETASLPGQAPRQSFHSCTLSPIDLNKMQWNTGVIQQLDSAWQILP